MQTDNKQNDDNKFQIIQHRTIKPNNTDCMMLQTKNPLSLKAFQN